MRRGFNNNLTKNKECTSKLTEIREWMKLSLENSRCNSLLVIEDDRWYLKLWLREIHTKPKLWFEVKYMPHHIWLTEKLYFIIEEGDTCIRATPFGVQLKDRALRKDIVNKIKAIGKIFIREVNRI